MTTWDLGFNGCLGRALGRNHQGDWQQFAVLWGWSASAATLHHSMESPRGCVETCGSALPASHALCICETKHLLYTAAFTHSRVAPGSPPTLITVLLLTKILIESLRTLAKETRTAHSVLGMQIRGETMPSPALCRTNESPADEARDT